MNCMMQQFQNSKGNQREDRTTIVSPCSPMQGCHPSSRMPTLDKFDGTSYLKSHLKMYMRTMQP